MKNKYDGHTPGPFTYGEGADREWYIHDTDENWIGETLPLEPGEAEANAALFADAPKLLQQRDELLAALQTLVASANLVDYCCRNRPQDVDTTLTRLVSHIAMAGRLIVNIEGDNDCEDENNENF